MTQTQAVDTAHAKPLTKAAARKLTDRIAMATGLLWQMVAEAHEREAWRALGYDSWQAYVDAEFQISRSQAFRLLTQARVVGELVAAGAEPADAAVAVSARQAAVLADQPKAVKQAAKRAAKSGDLAGAVAGAVDRVRSAAASEETSQQGEGGEGQKGSSTSPGAHRGAAAPAEKRAEAQPDTKPDRRSTPQRGEDQAPPVPSPAGGAPATQDGVRTMIAMVETTGASTIAHCCTKNAILAAIKTLRTALIQKEGGDRAAAQRAEQPTAKPLERKTVTPIPKSGKR